MTNSQSNKILAIITTVFVILLGIMFIVCCAHLYFTGGDNPYSRFSVGKYLRILAVPSSITIVLIIGSLVVKTLSGEVTDKKTRRTNIELLESFSQRYDISSFDEKTQSAIMTERKSRETFKYIAFSFSAVVFVLVLVYMLFVSEFTVTTLNADVVAALTVALPLSAIALGIHVPRVYLAESSAYRELNLMKEYIKKNGATKAKPLPKKKENNIDFVLMSKCLIITVSVVLVIVGIFNGGMSDVLQKAVKICTECIGLG